MYPVLAFFIVLFWTVVLLYGLWRDTSIRSRLIRLLLVFLLWKIIPPCSGGTINELITKIGNGYPTWVIAILAALIPFYMYGFILQYKEGPHPNKDK